MGTGPIVFSAIAGGGSLGNLALYIVGPAIGGALAAVVFKFLQPEE